MKRRKLWFDLIAGVLWVFFALTLLLLFNRYLLGLLPLGLRMVMAIVTYWSLAAVPLVFALKERYQPFQLQKPGRQVLWGLGIGLGMSLVLTLVPHLLGLGQFVGSDNGYTKPWQFAYELVYQLAAVAFTEELIFRGFLYHRLRLLFRSQWIAIGVSSALFGLFHFGSGDIVQILMTGLLGVFFCLCRKKLKHCTLVSLIIAHGLYNWLIRVWAFLLG